MLTIDSETYKVDDFNHHKAQSVKTQIVLGTSLRRENFHIIRLQHKEIGNTKRWNTYTIARNGVVYQHFDNKFHSDFLDIKEADKKLISIIVENMGYLFKTTEDRYINWLSEVCETENVIEKEWFGYKYWEKFSDEQLKSIFLLCKQLCEEHNIPKQCVDFYHYNKEIIKYKGIVFRSNYIDESSDINPLFDIPKFNEMLHNELA
jgi:hypothetical protein